MTRVGIQHWIVVAGLHAISCKSGGTHSSDATSANTDDQHSDVVNLSSAEGSTPANSSASTFWPPPHLLRFIGFGEHIRGLAVDDRHLYWLQSAGLYRGPKDRDGDAQELLRCHSDCQHGSIIPRGDWIHVLRQAELVRIHRDTLELQTTPLPWNHAQRGALAIGDDGTVYTALPACMALTRTRPGAEPELLVLTDVEPPSTQGGTQLVIDDQGRLICGSPSAIYVLDAWDQPHRVLTQVNILWTLATHAKTLYWIEENKSFFTPLIGTIPVSGGSPTFVYPNSSLPEAQGYTYNLLYIPKLDRLIYGSIAGLVGLNPHTKRLDSFADGPRVYYHLAADSAYVYTSVSGRRPFGGDATLEPAVWIARVGIDSFQTRQLDLDPATIVEPDPPNWDCPIDTETVRISKGSFDMGRGDARREFITRVTLLSDFDMDRTEVTVRQYAACVADGACSDVGRAGNNCNSVQGLGCHPMNCVNQIQAKAFCSWAGKQLPSPEEWEFAARGSELRPFPWGNTTPNDDLLCWSGSGRIKGTCEVGSFPAGATKDGLLDMAGNVLEWTDGIYCNTYSGTSCSGHGCVALTGSGCSDTLGPAYGGGWLYDLPERVMGNSRDYQSISRDSSLNIDLGFRCLRRLDN